MEIALASNHPPGSAPARLPERVSAADLPSPLLLKRLQQQKKKLAEARKNTSQSTLERTQQWTGEQAPEITPPKSSQLYMPSSSGKDNRRRDIDRKIEGMGVREMDLFISNLKKENFDLKLNLYHLREKGTKNEVELKKLLNQLRRANIRAEELAQRNDQLHQELQEREHALTKAVEMITMYEDRYPDYGTTCNGNSNKPPEGGDMADGVPSPKSGSKLKSQSLGISPFSFRNSPPSLSTPFRSQICRDGNVSGSPCPSISSNLIDLNTPGSVAHNDVGLTRAPLLLNNEGHKPMRLSLSPSEFMTRCTSLTSDNPPEGEDPPSPTHSNVSALDSPQLSVLSDSSFASMYRNNNEDNNPEHSDCNERVQFMGTLISPKKWGKFQIQKTLNIFTPGRRVSPTRRMSPRMEIMEFKDKQDKQRERISRSPYKGRADMPPTPESISPRGALNSSEDGDNDDDINCSMSMISPTEIDDQTKCTSVDEDICRPTTRNILETPSIVRDDTEIPAPRLKPQRSFKFKTGQTTTAAQQEQAFGDITNMRDTHNRLGYGFGDRLGNRNYTCSSRKQVGRDLTYSTRKHVSGNSTDSNEVIAMIPVKTIAVRMETPVMSTDYNLRTPPYTPNSDESTALRRLARKGSWESFASGNNSNSDRAARHQQQLFTPNSIAPINLYNLKRRNSTATLTTGKLSAAPEKGFFVPANNMRRPSAIMGPEVRRQSGIPSLVRSSSQKLGAKERRWQ